ncbi:hypothetical protein AVEN_250663-1 [Araneus ventricosus]|uniref:Uncharacterized protein n=1 Tax=Araneus ventricosus TaxID=182803 RepID=A0A4Y2JUY3_ARAVE|nr:hypothetical protein AVEN_250663-1 [Araneus ventricosus]
MGSSIFTPHIANPLKRVLCMHFGNDRSISCRFPTNWPPRSPDLNSCDFWLKHAVLSGLIANLAELETRIAQNIHDVSTDTFRSVVEHCGRKQWTTF